MKLSILILLSVSCTFAQKSNRVETGTVDAHAATWIPPTTTFASPPSSPPTGAVYIFTDASSLGTCSGGGTSRATCRWNGASWEATGGGGSGGGASTGGVLTVTLTDSTDLTIGANCTPSTPCKVRVGDLVHTLTSSATVTISAGTGMAWIWVDATGTINVGQSLTATCSGATCSSATNFPVSAVFPVWTWTATSGTWDALGGTDWTSTYAIDTPTLPGTGIVITETAGSRTIATTPVDVSQLDVSGLADGTYCLAVVSGVPSWTACSGAPSSLSWAVLTNGQWTGMTNGQWTGIAN